MTSKLSDDERFIADMIGTLIFFVFVMLALLS